MTIDDNTAVLYKANPECCQFEFLPGCSPFISFVKSECAPRPNLALHSTRQMNLIGPQQVQVV